METDYYPGVIQAVPLKNSLLRSIILVFLILITGGLFFLVYYWLIPIQAFFYEKSHVSKSTHVKAFKSDSEAQIVPVVHSSLYEDSIEKNAAHSLQTYHIFTYKNESYVFDTINDCFVLISFNTQLKFEKFHKMAQGLSNTEIITDRKKYYGECIIHVPIPTVLSTYISQILRPWFIYQICSVIVWCTEVYYWYSIAIFVVMVVTLIVNVYYYRSNLQSIRNLASHFCYVKCLRSGQQVSISSIDLVPGDVIVLSKDLVFPCDLVLVKGFCLVDETMLTGESQPVIKEALPNINNVYNKEKLYTLNNGTKIVTVNEESLAIVIATGYNTAKGQLVRSILYPKPNRFKFERDSYFFIIVMIIFGIIGSGVAIAPLRDAGYEIGDIALYLFDLITTAIPAALPLTMAIGVGYSMGRFKFQKISCIAPPAVYASGRVNIVCFDKTGTLTKDEMSLKGVFDASFAEEIQNLESANLEFQKCLAACQSLTMLDDNLIGDTQEIAIIKALNWTASTEKDGKITFTSPNKEISISRVFTYHFAPETKRMGVVVNTNGKFFLYIKGAPEIIFPICDNVSDEYYSILLHYTRQGYRVLACAYKELESFSEGMSLFDIEKNSSFLGLLLLENPLKDDARKTIRKLKKANINCLISTGDNVLTGLAVGKKIRLVKSKKVYIGDFIGSEIVWEDKNSNRITDFSNEEDYELVVTGNLFEHIYKENHNLFNLVKQNCKVYGRMSPQQKILLIEAFQEKETMIAMVGDGANDCGALKQADVGLSLSEAEASIAAPFCAKELSKIVYILLEGRTALVSSYQCFRFMMMYSLTEFSCTVFLYRIGYAFNPNQYIWIDIFTVLPLTFTMANSKPFSVLSKEMPPGSLVSVPIIVSIIGHMFISIGMQVAGYEALISMDWYPYTPQLELGASVAYPAPCVENNVLWIITSGQLVMLCFAFGSGRPFRQPIYYNYEFCITCVVLLAFDTYFILGRSSFTYYFVNEIDEGHMDIRWITWGILIFGGFVSIVYEKIVVPLITRCIKKHFIRD